MKDAQSAVPHDTWFKVIGSPNIGSFLPDNILADAGKVQCLKTLFLRKKADFVGCNDDDDARLELFINNLGVERLNIPFRKFNASHVVPFKDGLISLMGCTAYNIRANARPLEDLVPDDILIETLVKIPLTVVPDPDGVKSAPYEGKLVGENKGRLVRTSGPWYNLKTETGAKEFNEANERLRAAQVDVEQAEKELKEIEDAAATGGGAGVGNGDGGVGEAMG